jgi:hypothetical protein
MRGGDERAASLFSYVDLEAQVGAQHPLRTIRTLVNEALIALSGDIFAHGQLLLEGDIVAKFVQAVLDQRRVKRLLSADHIWVDGPLIEAWASMNSFKPKDESDELPAPEAGGRNAEANFHGQKRSNETHASTTDPQARLYRKGAGKKAKRETSSTA